jgi:hypothetical protein
MRKLHLAATAVGTAVLVFGAANAGPGGGMGMQGMPGNTPSSNMPGQPGAFPTTGQSTDTCGDNSATRIPCPTHKDKANTKAKSKGAASADTSGANASAKTGAAAKTDPNSVGATGSAATNSSASTNTTTSPNTPH